MGIRRLGRKGGEREYINPECLAGILGEMLDYNIDFLTFRGSSNKTGAGHPSKTHSNGLKTDIAYFRKDRKVIQVLLAEEQLDLELNVNFIKALIAYGYRTKADFYTERFTPYGETSQRFLVDGMTQIIKPKHDNHLHIGGFKFSTVIKETQP